MPEERPGFGDDELHDVATQTHSAIAPAPREVLRLTVVSGPDAGTSAVVDPDDATRMLVGTSPACALRLSDPTVSRRHVAVEVDRRGYRVVDLGSTNGTLLEGIAIRDAWVRAGQTLYIGSTVIHLETDTHTQRNVVSNAMSFGRVIGASAAMRRIYPLASRIARASVPVIIEGETGTGKEQLAEALHEASGSSGPFVVFDCTTVSPSVVESELFGHERGAFTGAAGTRPGIFEEADGGTLLIDEIGDLALPLQAKLLRVIDRGELRRVGGTNVIKVNVRIMAATRRDLDRAVTEGSFRDDLFHRLAVARIELPPLREREGDVALLIRHFAEELGGSADAVPPHVVARFVSQTWPGNVRELRNAVARYVALGDVELPPRSSPPSSRPPLSAAPSSSQGPSALTDEEAALPFAVARRRSIARFEREYVERLVATHGGNVSQAARASGVGLRYFRAVKARTK